MPQFSQKEIRVCLVIGIAAFITGIIMYGTGQHYLAKEVGVPEYLVSLRNAGVTVAAVALLWTALAGFRKSQLR